MALIRLQEDDDAEGLFGETFRAYIEQFVVPILERNDMRITLLVSKR